MEEWCRQSLFWHKCKHILIILSLKGHFTLLKAILKEIILRTCDCNKLCKKAIRYRRTLPRVAYRTTIRFCEYWENGSKFDRNNIGNTGVTCYPTRESTHLSQAMNCYIRLPFRCQHHRCSESYYFFLYSLSLSLSRARARFIFVSCFSFPPPTFTLQPLFTEAGLFLHFVVLRVGLFLSLNIWYRCIQRPTLNWNTLPKTSER